MKYLLWFLGFLFTQIYVYADLDDNEQQLSLHLGVPLAAKTMDKPGNGAVVVDRLSFNSSGLQTDVVLFEGVAAEESIYHRPYCPLTKDEVAKLLAANSDGQSWKSIPPVKEALGNFETQESWERTDGSIANVEGPPNKPKMLLHVKSKKLADAYEAAQ
jgi:hypothetical protein